MTVQEFKNLHPEYSHLEGDELWDAMTDSMLHQQQGAAIIKKTLPFWKRYKLRYLFYRKLPNYVYGKNDHSADKRCSKCKKGVSYSFGFIWMGKKTMYCPNCGKELIEEANSGIKRNLWIFKKKVIDFGCNILDFLHIVRSSHHSRYDMFGDERHYVHHFSLNTETGKMSYKLKKRKWWQWIFIEK